MGATEFHYVICDECGAWDRNVGFHFPKCSCAPASTGGRSNANVRLPKLDVYGNEIKPSGAAPRRPVIPMNKT